MGSRRRDRHLCTLGNETAPPPSSRSRLFLFSVGFLPKHTPSIRERLETSAKEAATQIFFVPPHGILQFLTEASSSFGDSREYREHVKDLSCLSNDFCRIVIVDNNPFSFLLQPQNGIPCIPFSAGQPCDDQLLAVILPLFKQLSLQNYVRPVLYEGFHMPEWFQKHGIPSDKA